MIPDRIKRTIKKKRNLTFKFIDQFDKEWTKVCQELKSANHDLSKIVIVERYRND